MPKLLQINVCANWGSTGRIAEQIGQYVSTQGWESYIAYGRSFNPSESSLIRIGSMTDTVFHYLMGGIFDMEGRWSRLATRRFLKEIEKISPDVIHIHNIHDHYLNYPMLFKYLMPTGIPVVWTMHDIWAITGHCPFNCIGCEKWKTECFDCGVRCKWGLDRSKSNYYYKKEIFTSYPNLTIVPVSSWLESQIMQSFLSGCRIQQIANGVDTELFKPTKSNIYSSLGLNGKKIIAAFASIWSKAKGLDDLLELSKYISDEWRIVIVGMSDSMLNTLPTNVIGIPMTHSQNLLTELYSNANVLMSLSRYETFGLTIAEGLACGTPAIVYNNTAQPNMVDENTGTIVETGDIKSVLSSLDKYKDIDEKRASMCRQRAQLLFDRKNNNSEYFELYARMLNEKK